MEGRVVAAHGRQYVVELPDGVLLPCFPRGKRSDVACGDRVDIQRTSDDQGTSLLYRSNVVRQKLIAANVDQIVIVVATEPGFSDELVTRALLAAESEEIEPLIVLNKCDLSERVPAARAQLAVFGATREISAALNSGKHTTTHATLYHLDTESELIDSPGLQEFGLGHLDRQDVEHGSREFRPCLGQCRFRDCHHDREPDCALTAAVAAGRIDPRRFTVYHRIIGTQRVD